MPSTYLQHKEIKVFCHNCGRPFIKRKEGNKNKRLRRGVLRSTSINCSPPCVKEYCKRIILFRSANKRRGGNLQ